MSDDDEAEGLRERLTRTGEDTLGKLAEDLLENPLVSSALSRAMEARDKAGAAQEAAFSALNIPTAADIERLTRRVRSVSQRLEGIEDGIDRLDERFSTLAAGGGVESRLDAIEQQLAALTHELGTLREALPGEAEPVPAGQERLTVPG
ncbi:MAG: hypothetical protein M3401_03030 [Actinomycetota bacterium]|nr:hypothetical protein [Actinomycetota bacterium]